MSRSLPPLAALRAFEAAARHLSFTRAAAELGMTQAAVSYQIKILEERVGTPLFRRERRQVELTEAGRRLADASTLALDQIAAAFDAARGTARSVLTITVTSTFAAYWLAPNLGEFHDRHPNIIVKLINSEQLFDLERDGIDIAIRAGAGQWPGLTAHALLPVLFSPLASPAFLERIGGVETPADLLGLPLIDPTDPWWNIWFETAGVSRRGFEADDGHKMGSQHLEAVAAMAGRGFAILTPFFYRQELASGRLVQPFDLVARDDRGYRHYWLCYPTHRRNAANVRAFRDWMLEHFQPETEIEPASLL